MRLRWAVVLAATAILAAACSSSGTPEPEATATSPLPPCDESVSDSELADVGPGGLLKRVDVTGEYSDDDNFPNGARAWRIHYVSTGVDETDLVPVCGFVVAPDKASDIDTTDGRARMFAWSHGTIGIGAECQPSTAPERMIWGPTPGGIGAVAWGADTTGNRHEGEPENGILQYLVDEGIVVAFTDYQVAPPKEFQPYIVGKVEGSNVLDAARAGSGLVAQEGADISAYDLVIAGHSQGGHAAFFAAQLAEKYLSQTSPKDPAAEIALVGVAMDAPASNLIIQPQKQPDIPLGHGLADSDMHLHIDPLIVEVEKFEMQIGPALFSYIFGSWAPYSTNTPPAEGSAFPAWPAGADSLALDVVATGKGIQTIDQVAPLCLDAADAPEIQKIVNKYQDAKTNQMLVPEIWNLPSDYTPGQYFRGGLDKTCATTTEPAEQAWCDWVRYNIPGPLGTNPFDKVPERDGKLVPAFIAQGTFDDVVFCRNPEGNSPNEPPPADFCMARAFYDQLTTEYCPGGSAEGHLQIDFMRNIQFRDPSDHLAIAGQIASASQTKTPTDKLEFKGSRLEQFVSGAYEGNLDAGCTMSVVNKES